MKPVAVLLVTLLVAACGSEPGPEGRAGATGGKADRTVAIYSAVVRRLVTVDHTFGAKEKAPFRVIFVVDHPIEDAGSPMSGMDRGARGAEFTEDVKRALEANLVDLPPIEFVAGRDQVMDPKSNFPRVRDRGAVVTLGPIPDGGQRVKVPASLYFSALGGMWLTYLVERSGPEWEITGTTGPTSIS